MWVGLPIKFRILLVTMVIANIGSSIFGPFLVLYVKDLGADIGQVGLYFTIMAVAPVAFRILGGWISDNLGRVQTVAIGSFAGLIGFTMLWLAPNWVWLIPGGLAMDLGRALVGTSFRAYTAESADETVRAQVIGFTDSVFLICGIIGPPLGGLIARVSTYRHLFAVATGFMAVATAVRVWNASDLPFQFGRLKLAKLRTGLGGIAALILGGGLLTWIFAVDALRDFGYSLSLNLFSLYQKEVGLLGEEQIGLLAAIGSLTMALLMTFSGRLSDRIGERRMMVFGGMLDVVALVLFVNVRSFAGFVAATMLMHVAWSFFAPAFNSLLSKAVPAGQLGITYGLFETSLSLIAMPAPVIGAQLWQHVSPQTPAYVTAGLALWAGVRDSSK